MKGSLRKAGTSFITQRELVCWAVTTLVEAASRVVPKPLPEKPPDE